MAQAAGGSGSSAAAIAVQCPASVSSKPRAHGWQMDCGGEATVDRNSSRGNP